MRITLLGKAGSLLFPIASSRQASALKQGLCRIDDESPAEKVLAIASRDARFCYAVVHFNESEASRMARDGVYADICRFRRKTIVTKPREQLIGVGFVRQITYKYPFRHFVLTPPTIDCRTPETETQSVCITVKRR